MSEASTIASTRSTRPKSVKPSLTSLSAWSRTYWRCARIISCCSFVTGAPASTMVWPRATLTTTGLICSAAAAWRALVAARIEGDVGREAEAENPERRLRRRPRHGADGEAHAERGEGLLHRLHGPLRHLAIGPHDLENRGAAGVEAAEGRIGHALRVDVAQGGEAVFKDFGAEAGVAEGEEGGDVLAVAW